MNIFLCHASEDKPSVEPIQLALVSAGHHVFYDERSLPPAGDYHGRIAQAISESELFIFILSEHSIRPGKYTLSELELAKQQWPSPVNRVLTVNLHNISIHQAPAYLTATTILNIEGSPAAEVRSAVDIIDLENDSEEVDHSQNGSANLSDNHSMHQDNTLQGNPWWPSNNWQWFLGTIIALASIVIPLWFSNNSPTHSGTVNIAGSVSGGAVIGHQVNHGVTLEAYNKALSKRSKEIRAEFQASLSNERANSEAEKERRLRLTIELESTAAKLADIETSYTKTQMLLSEANVTLNELKGKIPNELLKQAQKELKKGETKTAYDAFARIADDGSQPIAKAAYEAARLAEDEIRYSDADRYYTKAVLLDENNPDYLNAAGSMADTLGDYQRGEPLLKQALTIRKRELGEEHPNTAASYNNLAANLNEQGKYEEAEPLYRKGLAIFERVLGEEHPNTAGGYNNVAYNLNLQGKYEEAEPLIRKGLAIYERVLGEEDPNTATSYNNVAYNLNAQGKYEEAEPLFRKGLAIRERVLGEEHPTTATSYNNLASNLNTQGKHEEAEPLYRKGLAIFERVLGEEHPTTATSYNNVASNLFHQGRYKEAEPLIRKAKNIFVKVLGSEHPNTKFVSESHQFILKKSFRAN